MKLGYPMKMYYMLGEASIHTENLKASTAAGAAGPALAALVARPVWPDGLATAVGVGLFRTGGVAACAAGWGCWVEPGRGGRRTLGPDEAE